MDSGRPDLGREPPSLAMLHRCVVEALGRPPVPGVEPADLAAEVTRRARMLVPALRDRDRRRPLLAPWLERAAGNEPAGTDVWERAAVMAVVRNCHGVEALHARGALPASAIVELTTAAHEPIRRCLEDATLGSSAGPAVRRLASDHPIAWRAFDAVASAWTAPCSALPPVVTTTGSLHPSPLPPVCDDARSGTATMEVDCGTSECLPPGLHHHLSSVLAAGPKGVMTVPSFSQIGRSYRRLFGVVDALLTHGCALRTVNYVLAPQGGLCRVPPVVPASGRSATEQLADWPTSHDLTRAAQDREPPAGPDGLRRSQRW